MLANQLFEVLSPLGLEAALQATQQLLADQKQVQQQRSLALEQAQYEALRARRQYDAVDPEHRLVAAQLERDWNQALAKVAEIEKELDSMQQQVTTVSEKQRQQIYSLAQNLPHVWHHPDSCAATKKNIVRALIKEIIVYVEQQEPEQPWLKLIIHWHGGSHTQMQLPKNKRGQTNQVTAPNITAIIAALARITPDQHIVNCLNRLGMRTATGLTWTPARVCSFRKDHKIAVYQEGEREKRGELTIAQASMALGINLSKTYYLIKLGLLPAQQACFGAPWIVQKQALTLESVQLAASSDPQNAPSFTNPKQNSFNY